MIKQIFSTIEHKSSSYVCLVSWMSEKIGVAKFDTGAVHTILTPDVICGRSLSSVELSNIKYYLEKKHSDVSVELESAFGQKLKCYLSCLHDVSIEDIKLKDSRSPGLRALLIVV